MERMSLASEKRLILAPRTGGPGLQRTYLSVQDSDLCAVSSVPR